MLTVRLEQEDHPTVYLAGEMDLDCADDLRETVEQAAAGAEMVVLDFAEVRFIDSSGTGIFVRLCLDLQAQGVAVRARNVPPVVAQVFDMLKVRALVGDGVFLDLG
jgi:anti-anti-sigma factor